MQLGSRALGWSHWERTSPMDLLYSISPEECLLMAEENLDSAATFGCVSDVMPLPTITWPN